MFDTVDKIISIFDKLVKRLDKVIQAKQLKVNSNKADIAQLEQDNMANLSEIERAERVKEKILSLVS